METMGGKSKMTLPSEFRGFPGMMKNDAPDGYNTGRGVFVSGVYFQRNLSNGVDNKLYQSYNTVNRITRLIRL